jgi:hypothetical protein
MAVWRVQAEKAAAAIRAWALNVYEREAGWGEPPHALVSGELPERQGALSVANLDEEEEVPPAFEEGSTMFLGPGRDVDATAEGVTLEDEDVLDLDQIAELAAEEGSEAPGAFVLEFLSPKRVSGDFGAGMMRCGILGCGELASSLTGLYAVGLQFHQDQGRGARRA